MDIYWWHSRSLGYIGIYWSRNAFEGVKIMPSSQPENQLDNDKEELRLKLLAEINDYSDPSNNEAGHHNPVYSSKELLKIVDQYTQSKLKAFAGEFEKAIGEDLPLDDKSKATDNTGGRTGRRARNQLRKQLREALKAIKERWNLNG